VRCAPSFLKDQLPEIRTRELQMDASLRLALLVEAGNAPAAKIDVVLASHQ
jgi:hypothetical protein